MSYICMNIIDTYMRKIHAYIRILYSWMERREICIYIRSYKCVMKYIPDGPAGVEVREAVERPGRDGVEHGDVEGGDEGARCCLLVCVYMCEYM